METRKIFSGSLQVSLLRLHVLFQKIKSQRVHNAYKSISVSPSICGFVRACVRCCVVRFRYLCYSKALVLSWKSYQLLVGVWSDIVCTQVVLLLFRDAVFKDSFDNIDITELRCYKERTRTIVSANHRISTVVKQVADNNVFAVIRCYIQCSCVPFDIVMIDQRKHG